VSHRLISHVLIAQESVATAEAQLRAMEEQGVVASRGYKSGTLSVTDVYEAKSKAELCVRNYWPQKTDLTVKHCRTQAAYRKAYGAVGGTSSLWR